MFNECHPNTFWTGLQDDTFIYYKGIPCNNKENCPEDRKEMYIILKRRKEGKYIKETGL